MVHIFDLFSEEDGRRGVDEGLIKSRRSDDDQYIYNYTPAAMFTPGAWDNPAVMICRGLITDREGNVIARPYTKFFNSNQPEAKISVSDLSRPVEVTDKEDGSLAILHYAADGQLRVATRGSFGSDQAIAATKWVRTSPVGKAINLPDDLTPLFEWVGPNNRIVLDYPEDELILLGAVHKESGEYFGPTDTARMINWQGRQAKTFRYKTLQEALDAEDRPQAEGLCVRFLDESRIVKVKQADYVALHKIVTGLSERTVWEHMISGKELDELLADLPDELHDWTRVVWIDLFMFAQMKHDDIMDEYWELRGSLPEDVSRKEFAAAAVKSKNRAYMFTLFDDGDISTAILKTLRPSGLSKAKAISEDVA